MIRRENLQVGKAVRKDSCTGVFNRYISLSFDSSTFEKRGKEQKRQPNYGRNFAGREITSKGKLRYSYKMRHLSFSEV